MDARCVTSWTRSSDAAPGGASGAATPGSAAGRTRHEPDRPGGPGRPDVGEPLGAEERPRACAAVQHTDGAVRRAGLHARRPDHDPADPLPALTEAVTAGNDRYAAEADARSSQAPGRGSLNWPTTALERGRR